MSRLSVLVRDVFKRATTPSTPGSVSIPFTASGFFKRILGDSFEDFWEYVRTTVYLLDAADTDKDGYVNKRETVAFLIRRALRRLGLGDNVPDWVINWAIEEVLAQLRVPDFKIPVPQISEN